MKADADRVDETSSARRPRDPRIDAAILDATAELLVEIGYGNLTMAAVAERARTTKTALYRRWSSKAELVLEAAFHVAPTALPTTEGGIVGDVRAALPGLMADMAVDADLDQRMMNRFSGLFGIVRERLVDAVSRGQVHADVDPGRLAEIIGGATLLRLLLDPGGDVDDRWVEQTAAIISHGVEA